MGRILGTKRRQSRLGGLGATSPSGTPINFPRGVFGVEQLPNGNLRMWIDPNHPKAYDIDWDQLFKQSPRDALQEIMEPWWTNGSYTIIDPVDIGAMIADSAPVIAADATYHDDGTKEIFGPVWWNPNYMVTNEIEELAEQGEFIFQLAHTEQEIQDAKPRPPAAIVTKAQQKRRIYAYKAREPGFNTYQDIPRQIVRVTGTRVDHHGDIIYEVVTDDGTELEVPAYDVMGQQQDAWEGGLDGISTRSHIWG